MKLKNILTRALTLALSGVMTVAALSSCTSGMKEFDGDLRGRYDYNLKEYLKEGKYKGIEIKVGADNISKEEIDAQIMNYNVLYTTTLEDNEWVYLEEGSVAEVGNIAEVKYQGYLDGKPMKDLVHSKEEGLSMALGSEDLIAGMDQHIIGMKIGDKKTVEFTVPDPCFSYPTYVGKTLTFELELCAIRATELAPIGEGLFEYYGCADNTDFEHQVITEIKRIRSNNIEQYLETRIARVIADSFEVKKYPEKELKEVKDSYYEADKAAAEEAGQTFADYILEEYDMTEKEYEDELDTYAKEMVFGEMIIYYIARNEQIALSNAAFDEKATELAEAEGLSTPAQYVQFMASYGYSEYAVRELIWGELVMDFLVKNTVQIKEG